MIIYKSIDIEEAVKDCLAEHMERGGCVHSGKA